MQKLAKEGQNFYVHTDITVCKLCLECVQSSGKLLANCLKQVKGCLLIVKIQFYGPSPSPPCTLDESSIPPPSSFDGDTSVEQSSLCDILGVTGFKDESLSSTDWEGPGPIPMDDSVEVFLSKMVNESQIINVSSSSDGSVLDVTRGQACGSTEM